MARLRWSARNREARSSRKLRRFHRDINLDKVFGTHRGRARGQWAAWSAQAATFRDASHSPEVHGRRRRLLDSEALPCERQSKIPRNGGGNTAHGDAPSIV